MSANQLNEKARGVVVGQKPQHRVAFHGARLTAQRTGAAQSVVVPTGNAETDLAAAIVLVNELRAALVEKGLISGQVGFSTYVPLTSPAS